MVMARARAEARTPLSLLLLPLLLLLLRVGPALGAVPDGEQEAVATASAAEDGGAAEGASPSGVVALGAGAGEGAWRCPAVSRPPVVACGCDLPHTLRCAGGGRGALRAVGAALRGLPPSAAVSLLDCTGLRNLTFLDLSENSLSHIAPDTFLAVPALQTLRLRGNKLTVAVVSALQGLQLLRDLDLSDNKMVGPLGPTTLPPLPALHVLQLAHNQLSSVKRGALRDLYALASLALHHNQIDVLEDHAFRELRNLVSLNLAHNRIVAVSGASLAHLELLTQLDLAHNFLRALTADLTVPLRSLRELRLDDNDISMSMRSVKCTLLLDIVVPLGVARRWKRCPQIVLSSTSGYIGSKCLLLGTTSGPQDYYLHNPLNCDCSLAEFAAWLANSSQLPEADRSTAICATPPSLENGLLIQVPPYDLLCGEEEINLAPPEGPLSIQGASSEVSASKATLYSFQYDGLQVFLSWNVDASAIPYTCNSLIVYEEMGVHEVPVESIPLQCNSSQVPEPTTLTVSLESADLQQGHNYRYCVLLLESGEIESDEVSLDWGCSDMIRLELTPRQHSIHNSNNTSQIVAISYNTTQTGTLSVSVQLWSQFSSRVYCMFTLTVYASDIPIAVERLNCSHPKVTFHELPKGPYRVCATMGDVPLTGSQEHCVWVQGDTNSNTLGGLTIALAATFAAFISLLGLYIASKRLFKQPKLLPTHQCFLAAPIDVQQHSRYVKLQATTRL
ncbi:Toll-like receptor 6 [Gryllus bimaculatus]|nr:Toll-like receptor 6 [Gryllus bimaculatus]